MERKTCIVLVGGPCSGKSSAGKLAAKEIDARYISSGDIARGMGKVNPHIHNDLSNGKMAPEDLMRSAILHTINNVDKDIIILDGFPRFGEQAEWLHDNFGDRLNIYYILFYAGLSTIIERSAGRNREDDKNLEQRLKYYYNITYKELYEYCNIMIRTDELSVNECSKLLLDSIGRLMEC